MPMWTSIAKKREKSKGKKVAEKRKTMEEKVKQLERGEIDISMALIQALIPIGLKAVEEKLQEEVLSLAGKKYQHGKEQVRWGEQGGSIYLRDQKIPIMVPRVRNKTANIEIPLEVYQKLQEPYLGDRQTMLKLLQGISMRKYQKSAELVPEVFGISASNLSRRFKRVTGAMIRGIKERRLEKYDFVCVFIDGKRFARDGLLIALGVTLEGKKMILDVEQSYSENSRVMEQFFDKLIERGLKYEDGLLFIVDGSKGIINAIENRFREYGFIQRCRWHKQENVISYLNEHQQKICKAQLQEAYHQTTYKEAKAGLDKLHREMVTVNQSAANSLLEGLEETLTLHKLGLSPELRKSLDTTNCIESVMSQLGQYTDKVDRWRNSYQLLRWTIASLLEIEPSLQRIRGFQYLNLLRIKMREEIKLRQKKQAIENPTSEELVAGIHNDTLKV